MNPKIMRVYGFTKKLIGVFGNERCNILLHVNTGLLIGGFGDGRCHTLLHVVIIYSFRVNNTLICRFESNSNSHIYKWRLWRKYQSYNYMETESNG